MMPGAANDDDTVEVPSIMRAFDPEVVDAVSEATEPRIPVPVDDHPKGSAPTSLVVPRPQTAEPWRARRYARSSGRSRPAWSLSSRPRAPPRPSCWRSPRASAPPATWHALIDRAAADNNTDDESASATTATALPSSSEPAAPDDAVVSPGGVHRRHLGGVHRRGRQSLRCYGIRRRGIGSLRRQTGKGGDPA